MLRQFKLCREYINILLLLSAIYPMIMKPISLYTPVEIAKGRLEDAVNVRPYSIQKYRENPFQ
jgi:hypothetical protein